VLPPDVNESQVHFAPAPGEAQQQANGHAALNGNGRAGANGNGHSDAAANSSTGSQAIRFGLAAIKGVGEVAVEAILKARNEAGRFQSLSELCERMDSRSLNRKVLEGLIKCGACDCFHRTRATLFSQIDRTLGRAASIISDRQRGQSSLFGSLEDRSEAAEADAQPGLPEWPDHELLACEKELLGFYVTGHPLTPYAPVLEKYSLSTTKGLAQLQNRSLTRLGGMIAGLQNGISKKSGKPYSLVTLEDLEGAVQVLCINENYDNNRELLVQGKAIFVIGEVNTGEDRPKIFPQEILALEEVPNRFTKQVHLRLHTAHLTAQSIDSARDLVAAHPGKCPLLLCFVQPGGEIVFVETHERFSVKPSQQLQQAADKLFGENTYYVKVDTSLPERAPRRWERRSEPGDED